MANVGAGSDGLVIERHSCLARLPAALWRPLEAANFPFFDHEFLAALESSGSVGPRTGWTPRYLVARLGDRLVGALCLYEKSHSFGEFVFDWDWARAYRELGLAYYPKFLAAVPFTPAVGPKLLLAPDADRSVVGGALWDGALAWMADRQASSLHALFLPPADAADLQARGFQIRDALQLHWTNRGYTSFDDFLSALTGKRRREIQRERTRLAAAGVEIERLSGAALTPTLAERLDRYYRATIDKKESTAYLTSEFFAAVFATMPDRVVVALARRAGVPLGAALFFMKGRSLYGRYWGCDEEVPFLHFELCYHQGIELAIERGLELFEAGAQGIHKLPRGFLPTVTVSAHHMVHPALHQAIGSYLDSERSLVEQERQGLMAHSPFR